MKKIQQFWVGCFKYENLENRNFEISGSFGDMFQNGWIISLADNKVLRAIREITNCDYEENELQNLQTRRKELIRHLDSEKNRAEILKLNEKIEGMLYIPQFVSVVFPSNITKAKYNAFNKNGFTFNGQKYVWLLCGASHQRTNRAMYCDERIYDRLVSILTCGANIDEMVLAKYNAYFALSSSATYEVSTPRVCVIDDCEIKMTKTVDWVTEDEDIERQDRKLTFNVFDGMGLISPSFAKVWADDIGCTEYLPSSFVCRATFIKGNLMVFDFHKFAKEIFKGNKITDIYGTTYKIGDIDVILTKSQFKLWNAYENWDAYKRALKYSGYGWGVSRTPPSEDKNFVRLNYQFLQVLNMNDNDIADICEPTVSWIKGVSGGDIEKAKLYLLGKIANSQNVENAWHNIQDNFVKAIMLEPKLINDDYIKNRILKSLNKRIRESYIGKLLVEGNYQEMFADGYALCEHAFGMTVKGLLGEFQHYSNFWNKKGVSQVAAMRSPLTWRSEVNLLNLQNNDIVNEWFKYMRSGIIYNIWGVDNMLHAGSDYDGDGVFTTSNETIIKCRYGGVPVAYEPRKAPKEKIVKKRLEEVAILGFNTPIGKITNDETSVMEMLSQYSEGSKQYSELIKRAKLFCYQQSQTIDSAKGIKTTKMPRTWYRYQKVENIDNSEDNPLFEQELSEIELSNQLCIKDRPYFMRHLYSHYNNDYKTANKDFDRYCTIVWGKKMSDLSDEVKETAEYKDMYDYYNRKLGFLMTNGTMNRVCRYMEQSLSEIKKIGNKCSNEYIYAILNGEKTVFLIDKDKLALLEIKLNEYKAFKKNKQLTDSPYHTYEQYYKSMRNKCLQEISSDLSELARLAVYLCYKVHSKSSKDFCWDCFGRGIVQNLGKIYPNATIPLKNESGNIEYLGYKYSNCEYEIFK